jgi:hypothetical protein
MVPYKHSHASFMVAEPILVDLDRNQSFGNQQIRNLKNENHDSVEA